MVNIFAPTTSGKAISIVKQWDSAVISNKNNNHDIFSTFRRFGLLSDCFKSGWVVRFACRKGLVTHTGRHCAPTFAALFYQSSRRLAVSKAFRRFERPSKIRAYKSHKTCSVPTSFKTVPTKRWRGVAICALSLRFQRLKSSESISPSFARCSAQFKLVSSRQGQTELIRCFFSSHTRSS